MASRAVSVTLLHNPACSKSRAALELLRSAPGVRLTTREYLRQPLSAAELRALVPKLHPAPPSALDRGNPPCNAAEDVVAAVAADASRMQRPIAVVGDAAVVGRPPSRVLELVEDARE